MSAPATLPQLITTEIIAATSDDPRGTRDPEEIVGLVTKVLIGRTGIRSDANWVYAVRLCVRTIYNSRRNGVRPRADELVRQQQKQEGTQRTLPGWSTILRFRIKFDDGLEINCVDATLAQIEVAANRYTKSARQNATKGRLFTALADAMRARGFREDQTVEEFYHSQSAA